MTDPQKKHLFDDVIAKMHMTPEEEMYVRTTVNSVHNGLERLFTGKLNDFSL